MHLLASGPHLHLHKANKQTSTTSTLNSVNCFVLVYLHGDCDVPPPPCSVVELSGAPAAGSSPPVSRSASSTHCLQHTTRYTSPRTLHICCIFPKILLLLPTSKYLKKEKSDLLLNFFYIEIKCISVNVKTVSSSLTDFYKDIAYNEQKQKST